MTNTETLYNIRISSLWANNPVTNYASQLTASGFTYNERAAWYSTFYELRNATEEEVKQWKDFAKTNRLKIMSVSEAYTRSGDYRDTFFKTYKPTVPAKYRCAYCGRKFERKHITVDHIFAVNSLMYKQTTRDFAEFCGIHGANEPKNLVAACRRCNSKKGTKGGLWIWRGFIGRSEKIWKIRKTMKAVIVCIIILQILFMCQNTLFPGIQLLTLFPIFTV